MIHFIINEESTIKYRHVPWTNFQDKNNTQDNFYKGNVWNDNIAKLSLFSQENPDSIYNADYNSVTFIFDNNILYYADHPITHPDIPASFYYTKIDDNCYEIKYFEGQQHSEPIYKIMGLKNSYGLNRNALINEDLILGRVGKLYGTSCIGFWNNDISQKNLKSCLEALVRRKIGNLNEDTVVFSNFSRAFEPFFLSLTSKSKEVKKEVPCDMPSVNVQGKPMTLGQILGDLHMVKGNRLDQLRAAFCGEAPELRKKMIASGCEKYVNLIDVIYSKINCRNNWDELKKAGRFQYRQNLKDMFRKGDLDHMSQKDIDSAWDELMHGKREHVIPSFKEWIKNEEQRRNGGGADKNGYK